MRLQSIFESIENFRSRGQLVPVLVNPLPATLARFAAPFIKDGYDTRIGGLATKDQAGHNLYVFDRNRISHEIMLESLYGSKWETIDAVDYVGFYIMHNWKIGKSMTHNTTANLVAEFSAVIQQAEIMVKQ